MLLFIFIIPFIYFGILSFLDKELKIADNTPTVIEDSNKEDDWNLVLVNKDHSIGDNKNINLVNIGNEKVDYRIYEPLREMLEAARKSNLGKMPLVVSGYRTREKQKQMYENKVKSYLKKGYAKDKAMEEASKWVAKPGHSEHEIGIAVDINGAIYDIYFWLQQNSYKYGFIFRYPGNKTDITGVAEEVWHYRYVGVEVATEIYQKGLCLEEYLELKNS